MKLKLVAAVSALAISALAHAETEVVRGQPYRSQQKRMVKKSSR